MLYKVLDAEGRSCNGGCAQWSLPTRNKDGTWMPGDWMPPIESELVLCENGYHGARDVQVLEWLGPRLFEMEYRGDMREEDDKVICREVRLLREFTAWNAHTARLFALWCVREALRVADFQSNLTHSICAVVEQFLNGQATAEDMSVAWITAKNAIPNTHIAEWWSYRSDAIGYAQAKMSESIMLSVAYTAHWYRESENTWLSECEIGSPSTMGLSYRYAARYAAWAEGWLAARRAAEAFKKGDMRAAAWKAGCLQAQQRQCTHLLEMLDQ